MAYGLKYFANYKAGNAVRTVQLLEEDYSGPTTEWFCSLAAPKDSQGDTDTLFDEIIVSKVLRLEFLFRENYDLTEFVAESRTFKCIILEGTDVKFEGYLEPYETSRAYRQPYYYVQMTATCGLNRLKKNLFQQTEFNEGNLMLTYFEILQRCLVTIGIDRNLRIGIHTYMNSSPSAPNPLLSVEVDVFRYFKDGVWADCQTVITDMLVRFNAQLYVDNDNILTVRSSADHILGFTTYIEYTPDGTPGPITSWPNLIRDINYENTGDPLGEANTMDGGEVALQPRVRKYTVEADMGGKKDPFTNGGLQLWTVDGPVGWEGNMPAALGGIGWTRVDTGIVGAPYAMHIRGKAPQPYYTTHKKGIWPFRKTVKTPKEPAVWWESQKIEYNYKEVDSINVGFEYYTDDNSAGFLYTIAFFAQDVATGKITMSYLNPTNAGVRLESDYQLLTAPPHPRVNPTTGITQSKGVIEHTIDMSNAYSTREIKTWARVWFYYSVDEPGKSGDEYWIYKIIGDVGAAPEFEVPEGDSQYKSILESNPYESDEGSIINMITGDYSAGFLGTTMKMGAMSLIPTGGWTRRGRPENISIYRACMLDRVAFTFNVPDVIEAKIWILEGEDISYSTILRFKDRSMTRLYKIVRLEFEHYQRIASVTAIEMTFTELTDIKQRSYTDARGLLDETQDGDTVYPGAGNTTGRIGIDGPEDAIEELQEDEVTPEQVTNGRMGVFEDIPPLIYTVKERSTAAVHLLDFLSEAYLETEQDDEELDDDEKHDPEDFVLSAVSMPTWVESVEIDKLSVYVTAKPTAIGEYSLVLSVIDDTFGSMPNVVVPIIVYPPVKVTYTLRDTSGLDPVDVAEVFNGAGFVKPEFNFDIKVTIDGHHEGWYGKLITPSSVITETPDPYALVESTDAATYIIGEAVLAELGFYQIDLGVYRNEGEEDNLRRVKFERIKFSFYDEETLAKAKFYLWGAESNTLIGPIKPDGSSVFENIKEPWDVKMDITDVMHDAGISVIGSEVGDLDENELYVPVAVEEATYFQFGEPRPEFDPSTYNVLLTLYMTDPVTFDVETVYIRAISFTINHKPVQPTTGVLELGSIPANTSNFDVIMELEGAGNSAALPTDGWSVRNKSESELFNSDEWVLYRYVGDNLVNIDISAYTGNPQTNTYASDGITEIDSKLFGSLTSLEIGNPSIHKTPSTFRVINRRRMDGVIVAIYQADFSFGPAVPIDDAPIGGPSTGTGGIILESGLGIQIITDDEYNTINVLSHPDQFDIDPLDRILKLKTNGVSLSHLAQLTSLSVIGNMSGVTATPTAVGVTTSTTLAGASHTILATALAVKTYVDNALTTVISGTADYFVKFLTATTIGIGTLLQVGTSVVNSGHFVSNQIADANVRGMYLQTSGSTRWGIGKAGVETGVGNAGSDWVLWSFSDTAVLIGEAVRVARGTRLMTLFGTLTVGGSGVVISTTSTTLNPNFNADLLDSQHGVYYLDRTNHTGTQLAATISDFAAAVRAVPLTGLVTTTSSAILATDSIIVAFGKLQAQINTLTSAVGTGTVGYLPYYNTTTTFANSIAHQSLGTLTIDGFQIVGAAGNEKVRIAMDAFNSYVQFLDSGLTNRYSIHAISTKLGFEVAGVEAFRINAATTDVTFTNAVIISTVSTAPLVVSSIILVTNLNADLLDGQHGVYYLDRANHTGTQLASTISNFSAATLAVALTGLSIVTGSPITAADTILSAFGKLQGQINTNTSSVSGTAGQLAYFVTNTTVGSSIAKQASGTLTVEGFQVVGASANEKVRIAMDAANSYVQFSDSALVARYALHSISTKLGFEVAGVEAFRINQSTVDVTFIKAITVSATTTAPFVVNSTILVTSLNADLLDGQHGAYYLDRANHTGSQAISTITGLQAALDAKVTGSGVANRFALWTGTSTIASSNLFYNGGNVGVGVNPGYQFEVSGSIKYSVQMAATVATGTAPFDITSTTLCVNLNADMVDGQHASAFAAASHTHTIANITGLQAALDSKPTGSGTTDRLVLWTGTNTQGSSNVFNNGGNIGIGMVPGYQFDVNGAIRYSSQLASTIATGTAPMTITSTTLVTNLNADLLDGQHASAFAAASHTHTASQITDFTSAARGTLSAGTGISYNSSTGVISFSGSTGLTGTGSNTYFAIWSGTSSMSYGTVRDTGSEINFASGRSFGVEGPAAMRNYLHVWGYQANGTATNHGTLILHNLASATADGCAAIEILSTTRGFLNARMTRAQKLAITPVEGLVIYQTDTVGVSIEGLKLYCVGQWQHIMSDPTYG